MTERLNWWDVRPWQRAVNSCTSATTRKEWEWLYQEERLSQREMEGLIVRAGSIGSVYGVTVIRSERIDPL